MINLKAFINSMKATWLRRVINSDCSWQYLDFKELFSFEKSYTDVLLKEIKNQFWIDDLKAYVEILKMKKVNCEEFVLACPVFYNQ